MYKTPQKRPFTPTDLDSGTPPASHSGRWERWQMERLYLPADKSHDDEQKVSEQAKEKEKEQKRQALQDAKQAHERELAKQRAQAQKEGFEQGFAIGEKEGFEQGLREGVKLGLEQGREKIVAQVAMLEKMQSSWAQAFEQMADELGQDIIAFAMRVAQSVTQNGALSQPMSIAPIVEQVLSQQDNQQTLVVRLNPKDLEQLSALGEQVALAALLKNCQVVSDETVAQGGCFVQSPFGQVDASLQKRWEKAYALLGLTTPELTNEPEVKKTAKKAARKTSAKRATKQTAKKAPSQQTNARGEK